MFTTFLGLLNNFVCYKAPYGIDGQQTKLPTTKHIMSYGGGGYYGGGYEVGPYRGGGYDDREYDGRGHHVGGRRGADPYDRSHGRRSKELPEHEKNYRETIDHAKKQRHLDQGVAAVVSTSPPFPRLLYMMLTPNTLDPQDRERGRRYEIS